MTTKFAVAGTGWVAGEYLKAIHRNPYTEVYAVYSQNMVRAAERLHQLDIDAKIYESFEEMVKDASVDAVVLCSTPDVRPKQAILAAQYGKHLVLEKPLAVDRASMMKMGEAIRRSGVCTVVSFVLRWNPAFLMTKALIDDDAVGRIHMAQIDYWNHVGPENPQFRWSGGKSLGGSSMLSAGCHAVDALRYFAGDITEVTAYSCRTWSDSSYEFDPNVIAVMRMKNGGIAKVASSLECKTPYVLNVHLLGEKGSLMNNKIYSHKFPGQTGYAEIPTVMPGSGDVSFHPFGEEIQDFVEAIRQGRRTKCDFFDAYESMEVCFAIDVSIASGGKVVLG